MRKKFNVLILGSGRIGQATAGYFKKYCAVGMAAFDPAQRQVKSCDLLIGALPGEFGEKCLTLALRYKKNLIDISDVDPPFYLKHKKEIDQRGITVIPGCGFFPGLVNFILGHELSRARRFEEIEVKAGSLVSEKYCFPFLWCFEDLILEHRLPSWQLIGGEKKKFPPFAGYQEENFFGIEAESYLSASGFENLLKNHYAGHFKCRVIRPKGFRVFFNFLENQGLLKRENKDSTRSILEGNLEDNLTLAEITITVKNKKVTWLLKSFSRKKERLNSMQKITASVPAVAGRLLLENMIKTKGLVFMDKLGQDEEVFTTLLGEVRKEGIMIRRNITRVF